MTDWKGNRAKERYTYKRVRWLPGETGHFDELEAYGNITGGSVELAAFTDTKASCTFDFEGETPPDTTDLVRIYYSFEDDNGDYAETPIGTFFVTYGDVQYTRDGSKLIERGTANGSSVLSTLIEGKLGAPYTVDAGVDCVSAADSLVRGFGLLTNSPDSPGIETAQAHTFEPNDSWLTVINWLLTNANYQACYPDPFGTVMLVPYVDPEARSVVATFKDDEKSIMRPEVEMANDWAQTPNVVRLYFEDDSECLAASASLLSGSRASLAGRGGRELTMVEKVDELDGTTQQDRIDNLKAIARKRLISQVSEIEKLTLTHAFVDGIRPNDAVSIEYSNMSWRGNVTNMNIELVPSTQCETQLRRFVSNSLTISTDGGAVW